LGPLGAPRSISLIAILANNIPTEFPVAAQNEAKAAKPVTLEGRVDLRDLPLVTIDGADARDFDDAVFVEPDYDRANRGGWHMVIAIADVAHYVTPDSPLDRSAYDRGNSVYFADRVVPMLPEALSNDLCSLRPDEDRACMAVHVWIDAKGQKLSHRFVRGVMRSTARLTYEQAQAIFDGAQESPLRESVVNPHLHRCGRRRRRPAGHATSARSLHRRREAPQVAWRRPLLQLWQPLHPPRHAVQPLPPQLPPPPAPPLPPRARLAPRLLSPRAPPLIAPPPRCAPRLRRRI
jgi:exoribonuclease R